MIKLVFNILYLIYYDLKHMYTILFVSYPMDANTSRSCHGALPT